MASAMVVDKILEAQWIIPIVPANTVYENHSVIIKDGKIYDMLPTPAALVRYKVEDEEKDHFKGGYSTALMPGLINAHTHAAMSLLRSYSDDVPLDEWLQQYIWPAEAAHVSDHFCDVGVRLAIAEMIRCGTTCLNDMYFYPDVAARVAKDLGFRAVIGIPIICFPTPWANGGDEHLEKGMKVLETYGSSELLSFTLAPHAPYTVDDPTFVKLAAIAKEKNLRVHTHLHETAKEVAEGVTQHNCRPFERVAKFGLMNSNLIAVHATQLLDEEIKILAENKVNIIHCPESNLKLGSGICDVAELVRAGVNVGIGTDGPASNDDQDILGEVRTASLVSSYTTQTKGNRPMQPHVFLEMATINNARALGLDKVVGSIEVGKDADIIAVNLLTEPVYNPIKNVAHVGTNEITDVWIRGKQFLGKKKILCMDEEALMKEAIELGIKIKTTYKPVITHSEHPSMMP